MIQWITMGIEPNHSDGVVDSIANGSYDPNETDLE